MGLQQRTAAAPMQCTYNRPDPSKHSAAAGHATVLKLRHQVHQVQHQLPVNLASNTASCEPVAKSATAAFCDPINITTGATTAQRHWRLQFCYTADADSHHGMMVPTVPAAVWASNARHRRPATHSTHNKLCSPEKQFPAAAAAANAAAGTPHSAHTQTRQDNRDVLLLGLPLLLLLALSHQSCPA